MLSFEEREGDDAKEKARVLVEEFGRAFGNLWYTFHPDLPGEVKGKSSNTSWGAKQAKKHLVDEQHIPIEKITIIAENIAVIIKICSIY
jgi:hypothetical protein